MRSLQDILKDAGQVFHDIGKCEHTIRANTAQKELLCKKAIDLDNEYGEVAKLQSEIEKLKVVKPEEVKAV